MTSPLPYLSKCTTLNTIRGLGFKFVDFLYKSSDVCHTEMKLISSENIFFYLSYKLLSIALLIIRSVGRASDSMMAPT